MNSRHRDQARRWCLFTDACARTKQKPYFTAPASVGDLEVGEARISLSVRQRAPKADRDQQERYGKTEVSPCNRVEPTSRR